MLELLQGLSTFSGMAISLAVLIVAVVLWNWTKNPHSWGRFSARGIDFALGWEVGDSQPAKTLQ